MTELEYLNDTYKFESIWKVIEHWINENWEFLILDKTIFYPQWWWQPSDFWEIIFWEKVFNVEKVRINEDWSVYHYWKSNFEFKSWEEATLFINKENRVFNARNHSAGHLVDIWMKKIWLSYLKPTKWYHFQDGSYVEYEWELNENLEKVIKKLNDELEKLIESNLKIIVTYDSLENIKAPTWKKPRFVSFEGEVWCGCWGTHVKSSKEIWEINVRKIKYKSGVLKVSYEII